MAPVSRAKETAGDIFRRYKLDDLVRYRALARRHYLNPFTTKALALSDELSPLEPHHLSLFYPPWQPLTRRMFSYFRPGNYFVTARRGLPDIPTRIIYDKRLADMVAEQQEAWRRADHLFLSDFLSDAKAILPPSTEEEIEMLAQEEATDHAEEAAADENDEATQVEDEFQRRRGNDREAMKERVRILNQMQAYRRRFGQPPRYLSQNLSRLLYDTRV